MPQRPVVLDPFVISFDFIYVEQFVLVPFAEVPVETQRSNRQVRPAVADRHVAEVDVPGPLALHGDQRVRRASVAVDEHRGIHRRSLPERLRRSSNPAIEPPALRKIIDRDTVNRTQPDRNRTDRLTSTSAPRITDCTGTRERSGHEPLRFCIDTRTEHARCRVPTSDPVETSPFTIQIDPSTSRVPLHDHITGTEGQPAEVVAPNEFHGATIGDLDHDLRDLIVPEGVLRSKSGKVRFSHVDPPHILPRSPARQRAHIAAVMRSHGGAAKMSAVAGANSADLMPVVGLRLLEGRVGSTLLMQLLTSAPEVVCDRRHPVGEYRYLSYCVRIATRMGTRFDPERDLGLTETLFGPPDRTGPLPWQAEALSVETLGPRALRALWGACSAGFRERAPSSRWYAEKLACPVEPVVAADIPLRVVDVVRDPRDVVASMIAFGDRGGPWGFGRTPGETDDEWIRGLIRTFAARIDTMLAASAGSTLLRYEDFAVNLHTTADLLAEMLDVHLDADAALAQRPEDHVTTTSPEESIGRWRRDLAPHLADAIWSNLGSRLEVLGYTHG